MQEMGKPAVDATFMLQSDKYLQHLTVSLVSLWEEIMVCGMVHVHVTVHVAKSMACVTVYEYVQLSASICVPMLLYGNSII